MNPDIRPDQFFEIPFFDGDQEHDFVVNAKFDRIDHYAPLGIWILKMVDDQEGFIQAIMKEDQAHKLAKIALLPIVEREFLYKSEHELFIEAVSEKLDDWFNDTDNG